MQSTWVVIGRSTRNPALELSLIWSVCSRLVLCSCWCCDNVSFFSSFFREDLPCWFNDWVHFLFRHRWRFFDSKKKGASAWQNSPINRKAKYCSQAGNPAYWTNLNWTDVLTSTFLNVEGFWPPLKLAIMLRTHEILQQFCLSEIYKGERVRPPLPHCRYRQEQTGLKRPAAERAGCCTHLIMRKILLLGAWKVG